MLNCNERLIETNTAAVSRGIVIAILTLMMPAPNSSANDTDADYFAQWNDGTTTRAFRLENWEFDEEQLSHGVPMKLSHASLNDRLLFDPDDPVRKLWNASIKPVLKSPFVELANGDILPGNIVSQTSSVTARNGSEFALVRLASPLTTWAGDGIVPVRRKEIARVVLRKTRTRRHTPGLIIFQNGRTGVARRVQLTDHGVRVLFEQSVESLTWEELAEVHFPNHDAVSALRRDSMSQPTGQLDVLSRLIARNGAVFTYHGDRIFATKITHSFYHLLQPAWTQTGILVPTDDIASIFNRPTEEIPLSILPSRTLAENGVTFHWPWQRNKNVFGQPLSVGGHSASLGIGTYSHSEIAFDLPEGANSFSCKVGIDDGVGKGGCVRCKIFRDKVEGSPLWASEVIVGGDKPVAVDLTDISNATRLVLVTEYAHDERPRNADPLDIRDAVSWLDPVIRIRQNRADQSSLELTELDPTISGWKLSESLQGKVSTRPHFVRNQGRWAQAMIVSDSAARYKVPLSLSRTINVDLDNAWLLVSPGRDEEDSIGYRMSVYANGEKLTGSEGYDGNTPSGGFDPVAYSLGEYIGQKVKLTIIATPAARQDQTLARLVWGELRFGALIRGLPDGADPLKPEEVLESVPSFSAIARDEQESSELEPRLHFLPMNSGVVVPREIGRVECRIDPRWKRFVACIGPWKTATGYASFQVRVGEATLFQSGKFTRLSPGQQIDIRLPPNSAGKKLILEVSNPNSRPHVWANAGFMLN